MRKSKMLAIALFSVIAFIVAGCDLQSILSELNEEDDSKSTSNTVTITYVTELGNVPSPFTNTKNKGDQLKRADLPELEHDGYIFEGWYYQGDLVRAGNFRVYADLTLTAKWTKAAYSEPEEENEPEDTVIPVDPDAGKTKYTVTYETEHGTKPESITVVEDTILSAEQLPVLYDDGYTFVGWYDEDIKAINNSYKVTKDVQLIAKWKIAYIGTKEPSEEKEVGDIVFTDGSAIPYRDNLSLTIKQKNSAVAVIFYVGSNCNNNGDTTIRTYGVGIKQTETMIKWCTEQAHGHKKNIIPIQCYGNFKEGEFLGDLDGSDNLAQLKDFLSSENSGTSDDTDNLELYPAFNFAENYSNTATNLKGTSYETGWWLPSFAELYFLNENQRIVENAVYLCGGKKYGINNYWTSSQEPDHDNYNQAEWVWILAFHIWNGIDTFWDYQNFPKEHTNYACVIREF